MTASDGYVQASQNITFHGSIDATHPANSQLVVDSQSTSDWGPLSVSDVYVVDQSTGGSGAVLDDSTPQGALTYTPQHLSFGAPTGQSTIWADQKTAHPDPTAADPLAPVMQKWGFVFDVPDQQSVLKSVDFAVASAGGITDTNATSFHIALYQWSNGAPVGPAIYTSASRSLLSATTNLPVTTLTDFSFSSLNIPVSADKQYVWQLIADGDVAVATAPAPANGTGAIYHQDGTGSWVSAGTALVPIANAPTLDFAPALTTTGVVPFTDVNDTHTVSVGAQSGNWGNLVAWVATDTTGSNTAGEINWSYEIDPQRAAALALGEQHSRHIFGDGHR